MANNGGKEVMKSGYRESKMGLKKLQQDIATEWQKWAEIQRKAVKSS